MNKLRWLLIPMLLIVAGCTTPTSTPSPTSVPPTATATATPIPPTPTPDLLAPRPGRVVISEFIPGVPGNNNFEFIELYNAGTEAVDIKGWSLWYKMADAKEEERVAVWTEHVEIPGYGHYLLAREGEEIGAIPDRWFETPLFERKGGLVLRDAEGAVVDSLGWGDAPAAFVADIPAPAPTDGASLERRPGGAAGNGEDSDDSSADFFLQPNPNPQNSGSPLTPLPARRLALGVRVPVSVTPGTPFTLTVVVTNATGSPISLGTVVVPIPAGFALVETPTAAEVGAAEGPTVEENRVLLPIPHLGDGETTTLTLALRAPWAYLTAYIGGIYVETPDWPLRAYNALTPIRIEGGAIPIATARTLKGQIVTVEGIATMYTGGFYAGSTGTKFYLQDESGGIQVYCPGGRDVVSVRIGDRVRVTGEIAVYRDSLEIIPSIYPDDVQVLGREEPPAPLPITVKQATGDESILGRLTQIEGTVTRIEEFNYSFEVDITDDTGETALVYIEKQTGVDPEFLDLGQRYRVTGISELYSTRWQLKPRLSSDFRRVYPPELMLEMEARNSIEAGAYLTYTITAYNYTDGPMTHVRILAHPPTRGAGVVAVLDGGEQAAGAISWTVDELPGDGGSVSVRYVVRVTGGERIEAPPATATADQWPDPAESNGWLTFIGSGVPIWAIQGDGDTSPFVRSVATTEGLVTGVFPGLGGFWIQSSEPDDNPDTSEGLFVLVSGWDETTLAETLPISIGDRVLVTGKVREKSGQTLLYVSEVTSATLQVLESHQMLPAPVELDPPRERAASHRYYESLEGMLVSVSYPAVAVAPTSKYGEYALVLPHWGVTRVMRGDPKGMLIFVDDGSAASHSDSTTLPYVVKTGDMVGDLLGPLAFTYGNYKIQPILTPTVVATDVTLPTLPPPGPNEVSIATFNAENFFDFVDPHPSSPPKPKPAEYKRKLAKVADTIVRMGAPIIVGLQEIENVGVLEDLAAEPALADYHYVPALMEGPDSRGIDVGYLVRGDRATLEGMSQHPAPEGLTSRPPLLITVTVHLADGEQTLYVLNNHFTSMAGGEAATEPRRDAQAAWNVTLVQELLAAHPDAYVAVLGDLNSFYRSRPIETLREGGLRHVYEAVEPDIPYTYIFQGESETLDHILVTPALYEHLVRVEALHTNADFPPPDPEDTSARRASDHDPLVAVFAFGR